MDRFLDVCDQPKLNGEETNNLNPPTISNATVVSTHILSNSLDGLNAEFFKEERKPALYKLFLKIEKDASKLLLHSLTLMPKPDKDTTMRILLTNTSWAQIGKFLVRHLQIK